MKRFFVFLLIFLPFCDSSYMYDKLSDGTFTSPAKWEGDVNLFNIDDKGGLQLNAPSEAGEASVYYTVPFTKNMQWEIDITLNFNPSNANNARIYLYSTRNAGETTDYYIQAGSNNDDITLKSTKSTTTLIKGKKGRLNHENVSLSILITLENETTWNVYSRLKGEAGYTREGSFSKKMSGILPQGIFKINCRYSKTRSKSFYFDNIIISDRISTNPDTPDETDPALPQIKNIEALSAKSLLFTFNKAMNTAKAVFVLSGIGVGQVNLSADRTQITLLFPEEMKTGNNYTLSWEGVSDTEGNKLPDDFIDFTFETSEEEEEITTPVENDIIINEILYDPFTGGSEYIELYNRSLQPLNISSLFIATRKQDGTLSTHYPLLSVTGAIKPDNYFVITSKIEGVTSFYTIAENALLYETKLPVFSNNGATIVLADASTEEVIDEVTYSPKWHSPLLKNTKGVALERIHPDENTQNAANWTSASSASGHGTPGSANSQHNSTPGNTEDNGQTETTDNIDPPIKDEATGLYTVTYQFGLPDYSCKASIYDVSGKLQNRLPVYYPLGTKGKITWEAVTSGGKQLKTGIYVFFAEFFHPSGKTKQYKKTFVVI